MTPSKPRILFLCTGNSCRSQMAEGFTRALYGDRYEVHSAGTDPHGMNPLAIEVMAEAGVDISKHWSKSLDELSGDFDYIITVCDSAHESCPNFPGKAKVIHVGFDDPPRLAAGAKSHEEALQHYRRVRDAIRTFILQLPAQLKHEEPRRVTEGGH